jgi:hypothetical protein
LADFLKSSPKPLGQMNRNLVGSIYRGPSIDASYQISVRLAKQFRRRFLKIGQSETKIACGGHVCY